jgi:protein-S-isoprenylcysteine O-methyltransferase Ste14
MSGQDHSGGEPVNARIFPIPPVVAALFLAAGVVLNRLVPLLEPAAPVPLAARIAGGVIMTGSLLLVLPAFFGMLRAKTTFHPGHKANALVSGGVYRITRNPMYLSLTLLMAGLGFSFADPWLVALAPALLFYYQERVVKREEAYLAQRFGAEYLAYKAKVRRWL